MPELPDLAILADAFHASMVGRRVVAAEAPGPLTVRGTPAELDALSRPAAATLLPSRQVPAGSSSTAIGS